MNEINRPRVARRRVRPGRLTPSAEHAPTPAHPRTRATHKVNINSPRLSSFGKKYSTCEAIGERRLRTQIGFNKFAVSFGLASPHLGSFLFLRLCHQSRCRLPLPTSAFSAASNFGSPQACAPRSKLSSLSFFVSGEVSAVFWLRNCFRVLFSQ